MPDKDIKQMGLPELKQYRVSLEIQGMRLAEDLKKVILEIRRRETKEWGKKA